MPIAKQFCSSRTHRPFTCIAKHQGVLVRSTVICAGVQSRHIPDHPDNVLIGPSLAELEVDAVDEDAEQSSSSGPCAMPRRTR